MSTEPAAPPSASGSGPPSVEAWFAREYGSPEARLLRTLPRTAGSFHELATPDGPCWLRVGGVLQRSVSEVEAEARTAIALAERGLRLARPRPRRDGTHAGIYLGSAGREQPAVAYQHVPGDEVSHPDREQASALGRVVAELHALRGARRASGGLAREPDLPLCEPIRNAGELLLWARGWLEVDAARWIENALRTAVERLERLAPLGGAGLCHGDLRLGNVRFDAHGREPMLLDLEALGYGPRSYDLGCLWRRRVLESDFTGVPPDWAWFRQGYAAVLAIEDDEWQAVPLYAFLRAVWTMCLPTRPGASWGTAWIADPDYWAAHLRMLRWFAGAADLA